jgi:putative sterol carrier protein
MSPLQSKEELYALLDKMLAHLQQSEKLKAKIGSSNDSIGFIIRDLGAEFHLRFAKGEVSGGQGGAKDCTISVTMDSGLLERLLTGQTYPESAYEYGALSLRGSEWVAQDMLRYMPDLMAAYKAATAA